MCTDFIHWQTWQKILQSCYVIFLHNLTKKTPGWVLPREASWVVWNHQVASWSKSWYSYIFDQGRRGEGKGEGPDWLPLVRSLVVMVISPSDTNTVLESYDGALCQVMLVQLGSGWSVSILTLHLFSNLLSLECDLIKLSVHMIRTLITRQMIRISCRTESTTLYPDPYQYLQ